MNIEEKQKLIKIFIINNDLDFDGYGSDLNSVCTTISGYALSIGITNHNDILDPIVNLYPDNDCHDELERVFNYAKINNYGEWWKLPIAKEQYKF